MYSLKENTLVLKYCSLAMGAFNRFIDVPGGPGGPAGPGKPGVN
jgi:hypothetical protein